MNISIKKAAATLNDLIQSGLPLMAYGTKKLMGGYRKEAALGIPTAIKRIYHVPPEDIIDAIHGLYDLRGSVSKQQVREQLGNLWESILATHSQRPVTYPTSTRQKWVQMAARYGIPGKPGQPEISFTTLPGNTKIGEAMNINKIAATLNDLMQSGKAKNKGTYKPDEMAMGKKVEHEHTEGNKIQKTLQDVIARKISKDHLKEIPDYYTRLKKMEDTAKKQMGKKAEEGKGELTSEQKNKIIEFVTKSENLDDTTFHAFCGTLGVSPHEAEEVVYVYISKPKKEK